ncbi:hypothetical protein [Mesorhizobium sp. IMUNJ 23232]|uniref:hypothetical protein n=1 Tax=Mesorhizobium sp. IMUNJ 23232 TaxID=3376064 RepID=UPI0037AE5EC1
MLGYRKRSFDRAHGLLEALRADLDDFQSLKALQHLLLSEIARSEQRIRRLKDMKASDAAGAKSISYLDSRIDGFRRCNFIWRGFGDAIAFLYMDKYALKHTYFSTKNANPKQDAGFIIDKAGLAFELGVLDSAIQHGVPALLTDITNTIRHGDICLMGNSAPYLIEVKAAKSKNPRAKKQFRSIEKLHSFFETDQSVGLRGIPFLTRHASALPEISYEADLNECIAEARALGHAVRRPESGLTYIVFEECQVPVADVLASSGAKRPWAFMLNQLKSTRSWAPFQPFVLSIKNKQDLWDFISGKLVIMVMVEPDALIEFAAMHGKKAWVDGTDPAFHLHFDGSPDEGGLAVISENLIARIGLEFISPRWIVSSALDRWKDGAAAVSAHWDDLSPDHRVEWLNFAQISDK